MADTLDILDFKKGKALNENHIMECEWNYKPQKRFDEALEKI